jgi:hypothetical protein
MHQPWPEFEGEECQEPMGRGCHGTETHKPTPPRMLRRAYRGNCLSGFLAACMGRRLTSRATLLIRTAALPPSDSPRAPHTRPRRSGCPSTAPGSRCSGYPVRSGNCTPPSLSLLGISRWREGEKQGKPPRPCISETAASRRFHVTAESHYPHSLRRLLCLSCLQKDDPRTHPQTFSLAMAVERRSFTVTSLAQPYPLAVETESSAPALLSATHLLALTAD